MELEYHHLIVAAHMQLESVKVKDVSPHYFFVFRVVQARVNLKLQDRLLVLANGVLSREAL